MLACQFTPALRLLIHACLSRPVRCLARAATTAKHAFTSLDKQAATTALLAQQQLPGGGRHQVQRRRAPGPDPAQPAPGSPPPLPLPPQAMYPKVGPQGQTLPRLCTQPAPGSPIPTPPSYVPSLLQPAPPPTQLPLVACAPAQGAYHRRPADSDSLETADGDWTSRFSAPLTRIVASLSAPTPSPPTCP